MDFANDLCLSQKLEHMQLKKQTGRQNREDRANLA